MKGYRAGEQIEQGIYWSLATGEFFQSPAQGTVLPGAGNQRYIRMPGPLVLLVGPLFGLGYVVFLPLVGIVGLGVFLMRQLAHLIRGPVQEAARVVVPAWVPGVSYLVRGRRGKAQHPPKAANQVSRTADRLVEWMEQDLPTAKPESKPEGRSVEWMGQDLRERRSKGEK